MLSRKTLKYRRKCSLPSPILYLEQKYVKALEKRGYKEAERGPVLKKGSHSPPCGWRVEEPGSILGLSAICALNGPKSTNAGFSSALVPRRRKSPFPAVIGLRRKEESHVSVGELCLGGREERVPCPQGQTPALISPLLACPSALTHSFPVPRILGPRSGLTWAQGRAGVPWCSVRGGPAW